MHRSRRLAALVPLILAGASLAPSASGKAIQPTTVPTKLALVGGMVIDGYEAPPLHHGAILIEGDRIVRVAPAAQVTIPSDYQVIDTSGRTMMPGMIELHAHLIILGHGISALTRIGANILGRQRDLGTIEPGKLADIIVIDGNPLYDITALAHVETVVKGGRVFRR